jgi:hypothetical protein
MTPDALQSYREALDLYLQLVLQSLAIENLQARVLRFVTVSEENGGDVSLIEPVEEQEAALAEGKALLWERHEIECQLEGVWWWLAQRADLHRVLTPAVADCQQNDMALDVLWKERIEHFLPLNAYRRSYRDTHPRDRDFWWWTLLADCDIAAVYRAAEGAPQPLLPTSSAVRTVKSCWPPFSRPTTCWPLRKGNRCLIHSL